MEPVGSVSLPPPTAPVTGEAAARGDSQAAPDSALRGLRGNFPGASEPGWSVLGAGLSHGCSLSTVDPGRGRGLLRGAHRAVISAGLVSLGFFWGRGGSGVCPVGSEKPLFWLQKQETTDPGVVPTEQCLCFLHIAWDRTLSTSSTWGQYWFLVLSWIEIEASAS